MFLTISQINLLYVNFAMTHYPETDEAAQLMYVPSLTPDETLD